MMKKSIFAMLLLLPILGFGQKEMKLKPCAESLNFRLSLDDMLKMEIGISKNKLVKILSKAAQEQDAYFNLEDYRDLQSVYIPNEQRVKADEMSCYNLRNKYIFVFERDTLITMSLVTEMPQNEKQCKNEWKKICGNIDSKYKKNIYSLNNIMSAWLTNNALICLQIQSDYSISEVVIRADLVDKYVIDQLIEGGKKQEHKKQ